MELHGIAASRMSDFFPGMRPMSADLIDSSNYVKMKMGMHGSKLVGVAPYKMQDYNKKFKSILTYKAKT